MSDDDDSLTDTDCDDVAGGESQVNKDVSTPTYTVYGPAEKYEYKGSTLPHVECFGAVTVNNRAGGGTLQVGDLVQMDSGSVDEVICHTRTRKEANFDSSADPGTEWVGTNAKNQFKTIVVTDSTMVQVPTRSVYDKILDRKSVDSLPLSPDNPSEVLSIAKTYYNTTTQTRSAL